VLRVRSDSLDVFRNLAIEECLLGEVRTRGRILFLWRSRDAVVIGKNQDPWVECRVEDVEREGGRVARRISGGGAVFHDTGNLNVSFFVPRREYRAEALFGIVLAALRRAGVNAGITGKNSLSVDGKKISGNAFCLRRDAVLHHGTLLVSTDLSKLERYLRPTKTDPGSRAVRSKPAAVANLADIVPGLAMRQIEDAITAETSSAWGEPVERVDAADLLGAALPALEAKYASDEWRFGGAR
jgi:lipoate---protein ligase